VSDSPPDDDPIETAWRALLESKWDDEDAHRRFVGLAATLSRLPDAAARYRIMESDPERRDRAVEGKQLVLKNALALLGSMPRASIDDARKRARWLVPLAALGVFVAADFALAAFTHNHSFVSIPAFMLEIAIVLLLPWKRLLS
jgi:hypothetical protein